MDIPEFIQIRQEASPEQSLQDPSGGPEINAVVTRSQTAVGRDSKSQAAREQSENQGIGMSPKSGGQRQLDPGETVTCSPDENVYSTQPDRAVTNARRGMSGLEVTVLADGAPVNSRINRAGGVR